MRRSSPAGRREHLEEAGALGRENRPAVQQRPGVELGLEPPQLLVARSAEAALIRVASRRQLALDVATPEWPRLRERHEIAVEGIQPLERRRGGVHEPAPGAFRGEVPWLGVDERSDTAAVADRVAIALGKAQRLTMSRPERPRAARGARRAAAHTGARLADRGRRRRAA